MLFINLLMLSAYDRYSVLVDSRKWWSSLALPTQYGILCVYQAIIINVADI